MTPLEVYKAIMGNRQGIEVLFTHPSKPNTTYILLGYCKVQIGDEWQDAIQYKAVAFSSCVFVRRICDCTKLERLYKKQGA